MFLCYDIRIVRVVYLQNLEALTKHYRDPGLSVRKQVFQSLTDLLKDSPKDTLLQR